MATRDTARDTVGEPAPAAGAAGPTREPMSRPAWIAAMAAAMAIVFAAALLLPWWRQQTLAREEAAQAGAMATAEAAYPATVIPSRTPAPTAVAVVPLDGSAGGTQVIAIQNILPPSSPLAQEIRVAQSRFWQIYGAALYELDESRLPEVASGEALEFVIGQVRRLRAEGQTADVRGEHLSTIFDASETKAFIHDKFVNRSQSLDATTKKPIAGTPDTTYPEYIHVFERIDGEWKMTHFYSTTRMSS